MKRPFAITVVSWLFIAVGVVATVVHTHTSLNSFHREDVLIVALELVAVVAGVFMLRGESWARWVAVTWMAFHVVVGYLNGPQQVLVHAIIFSGITFLLFRADARAWFASKPAMGS
jgi:hypothetical protein